MVVLLVEWPVGRPMLADIFSALGLILEQVLIGSETNGPVIMVIAYAQDHRPRRSVICSSLLRLNIVISTHADVASVSLGVCPDVGPAFRGERVCVRTDPGA
jgi:hypothetical protein